MSIVLGSFLVTNFLSGASVSFCYASKIGQDHAVIAIEGIKLPKRSHGKPF